MKIGISTGILIAAILVEKWAYVQLTLFVLSYFCVGFQVLKKSFRNIFHGQVFDENFLMMIATFGAFVIGEYAEGVFVMLFYQVGELFESIAVGKSRKSISELMAICPEYANLVRGGALICVDPSELLVGDVVVVKPGEKIPVDGVVLEGESSIDTANLTGESVPRFVKMGDRVVSGCINAQGLLKINVEKEFRNSTVRKILDLVENASSRKSVSEGFITKFAHYYTPVVVILAVFLAVFVPIFCGDWQGWLKRALVFLVVSCPCALVISVPLSFFCGIGCASRNGILIKGSNYMEALSKCKSMVFDKTGTLTKGKFEVTKIYSPDCSEEELLKIAACGERYSNHPVAISICNACSEDLNAENVSQVNEILGQGIVFLLNGKQVIAGNSTLLKNCGIEARETDHSGTVVHISVEKIYMGYIVVEDSIKDMAADAIADLKSCGIKRVSMLSGDKEVVAERVGAALDFDFVKSGLLPDEKISALEALLREKGEAETLAYVGDGVNDAPVLSRADIGIAMGAIGSDAAIEAGDIVLMDDKIEKIPFAVRLSKQTMRIVRQNLVFALGIKFFVMIMSLFGFSNMWVAVFADVGVAFLAILNAMRMLRFRMK